MSFRHKFPKPEQKRNTIWKFFFFLTIFHCVLLSKPVERACFKLAVIVFFYQTVEKTLLYLGITPEHQARRRSGKETKNSDVLKYIANKRTSDGKPEKNKKQRCAVYRPNMKPRRQSGRNKKTPMCPYIGARRTPSDEQKRRADFGFFSSLLQFSLLSCSLALLLSCSLALLHLCATS